MIIFASPHIILRKKRTICMELRHSSPCVTCRLCAFQMCGNFEIRGCFFCTPYLFLFPSEPDYKPNDDRKNGGDCRANGDAPDVELRLFPPRQFLFNGVGNADSVRADSTQGVPPVMPTVDEKSAEYFHRVALFADKNAVFDKNAVAVKPVYIERVGAHGFHRHVAHAAT